MTTVWFSDRFRERRFRIKRMSTTVWCSDRFRERRFRINRIFRSGNNLHSKSFQRFQLFLRHSISNWASVARFYGSLRSDCAGYIFSLLVRIPANHCIPSIFYYSCRFRCNPTQSSKHRQSLGIVLGILFDAWTSFECFAHFVVVSFRLLHAEWQ